MNVEEEEYDGKESREKGRIWGKERGGRVIFEGRKDGGGM